MHPIIRPAQAQSHRNNEGRENGGFVHGALSKSQDRTRWG